MVVLRHLRQRLARQHQVAAATAGPRVGSSYRARRPTAALGCRTRLNPAALAVPGDRPVLGAARCADQQHQDPACSCRMRFPPRIAVVSISSTFDDISSLGRLPPWFCCRPATAWWRFDETLQRVSEPPKQLAQFFRLPWCVMSRWIGVIDTKPADQQQDRCPRRAPCLHGAHRSRDRARRRIDALEKRIPDLALAFGRDPDAPRPPRRPRDREVHVDQYGPGRKAPTTGARSPRGEPLCCGPLDVLPARAHLAHRDCRHLKQGRLHRRRHARNRSRPRPDWRRG